MDAFSVLLRACGFALVGCVCLIVIGRLDSGIAALLRVGVLLSVFGLLLYLTSESVSAILEISSAVIGGAIAEGTVGVMLKSLGLALVAKLCADVCRDCGESGLAGGVECVGRMAMLVVALPLFAEILELAGELLGVV